METKDFKSYREFSQKSPEKIEIDEAIKSLKEFLDKNPQTKANLGYEIGNLLKKELRRQFREGEISTDQGIEKIKKIYDFYKEKLGDVGLLINKNGFLAEFAVEKAFSVDAGYSTYASQEDEDKKYKIDLWVDLEPEPYCLATQIKCISGVKELNFIDLSNEFELSDFYHKYGSLIKDYDKFNENINVMTDYCNDQNENIIPVLIVLPSPESEYSLFNARNGMPGEELGNLLAERVENKFLKREELV